jgi:hypothetical protein
MFSGTMRVTQTRDEVRQKHSYAHEAAKRDSSNQRGEHICTVKYDMSSKTSSHTSNSQNHLFSHNSDGTCNDRIQHGQHRKSGISELFPTRQPQPSAEGLVKQKPNSSQIAECKTNVLDFVDWKQHSVDFVHHLPIITDLTDYKPNVLDVLDQKQNIAQLQSLFGESRHESSNRRPVISDAKQPVHSCQSIKLEPKPDINTVKKEDSMDICNGVGWSSAQPPPHGNISKTQGFFGAIRSHQTSSSSSESVLLPIIKSDEKGEYGNILCHSKMDGIKLYYRIPDIISPIQDRNDKDETHVAASVTSNNHDGNNNVMLSFSKECETPDLSQSFATKMAVSVSQRAKSASTVEEQVQPMENGVSYACSSLFISEHHHCSEEKKEEKEHNFRDMNRKDRKHRPTHKGNGKDHHKRGKAVSSAPSKISVPRDKFIWRSALNGMKIKIWRERVAVPQKAVRKQSHARRKTKVDLRAWFTARLPHLKKH